MKFVTASHIIRPLSRGATGGVVGRGHVAGVRVRGGVRERVGGVRLQEGRGRA